MRKIAYLASRFPAVSHTFIQREIQTLRELGFEIEVFSINKPDIVKERQSQEDLAFVKETHYIKESSFATLWEGLWGAFSQSPTRFIKTFFHALSCGFYSLFYLIEAAVIGQKMQTKGIKHLHVHFANPAANVANLIQRLYAIPYSITVHGPDEFYDVNTNQLVQKFTDAQFLVCISFYAKSQILRLLSPDQWGKVHLIRMGVDQKIYTPSPQKPPLFTIVCVGRLSISKGQILLCRAVKELQEQGIKIALNLIGEGSERVWLEKEKSETIRLLGALNPEEVRSHLENCDLFVLFSLAEGIPVSLMEAMSMEIPCIASGINGIPELIIHEKSGLLVYPSDVEGLKEAILRIYNSENLRQSLGKEGRQKVSEEYNLMTNTKQLANLLSSEIKA